MRTFVDKAFEEAEKLLRNDGSWENYAVSLRRYKDLYLREKGRLLKHFPDNLRWNLSGEELGLELDWEKIFKDAHTHIYTNVMKPLYNKFFEDVPHGGLALSTVFILKDWIELKVPFDQVVCNKLPSGEKLSKYILKNMEEIVSSVVGIEYIPERSTTEVPWVEFYRDNQEKLTSFVQIWTSKLVEQMKTASKLNTITLSIHPVDILAASSFTNNWRSCYQVFGGTNCYTSAPFAYLGCPYTVIAYASKRTQEVLIPGDSSVMVPVKEWRAWVHVDLDNMSALLGRPYPGKMPEYSRAVRELVAQKILKPHLEERAGLFRETDEIKQMKSLYKNNDSTSVTYRALADVGRFSRWVYDDDHPDSRVKLDHAESTIPEFSVLGAEDVFCLACGDVLDLDDCPDGGARDEMYGRVLCPSCCYNYIRCEACGDEVREEDSYDIFSEAIDEHVSLCRYCMDDATYRCDYCGNSYYGDCFCTFYDSQGYEREACQECYDNYMDSCHECGDAYMRDDLLRHNGELVCSSCKHNILKKEEEEQAGVDEEEVSAS